VGDADLSAVNWGALTSWSSHGSVLCSRGEYGRLAVPSRERKEGINLPLKAALQSMLVCWFGFFNDRSPESRKALWVLSRQLKWHCLLLAKKGIELVNV